MTDRDRLIELLNEVSENILNFPTANFNESLADYLIENGVIVPPCKVGDTVYCLDTIGNEIEDYVVKNVGITATHGGWGIERRFSAFGKTVFLTKEEAERELRKRGENNA